MKTPFGNAGEPEHLRGDPVEAEKLRTIFRVSGADKDVVIQGIHTLHPYPGRMHPMWARRIIQTLPAETSIIDPFCGSGTVLVEARRAGLHARGSDVNPIAVRLSRLRCIPPPDSDAIREEADRCVDGCTKRRNTPFSKFAQTEKRFPKHVLAGLISLRDEIEKTKDRRVKEVLLFSFSPLLDKFAENREGHATRVSRTAVRNEFDKRVARWLSAFEEMADTPWAEAEGADARWLPWKPGTSSAVITSPPHPGVLDYANLQEQRMAWLGPDDHYLRSARKREIGRQRKDTDWKTGLFDALRQMCRTTKPKSPFYLFVGDGIEAGQVIRADAVLAKFARSLPLTFVAAAARERQHFHRPTAHLFEKAPRLDHLVLMRRSSE